eukprot:258369_1
MTCRCHCGTKSHWKVLIIAFCSCFSISGMYSFFSNVTEVYVVPDMQQIVSYFSSDTYTIKDGIMCVTTSYMYNAKTKEMLEYCNNIAVQMANQTSTHNEWVCSSFTDYSDTPLYAHAPIILVPFIGVSVCSFLYAVFALIHDFTIINNRNNLLNVSFF